MPGATQPIFAPPPYSRWGEGYRGACAVWPPGRRLGNCGAPSWYSEKEPPFESYRIAVAVFSVSVRQQNPSGRVVVLRPYSGFVAILRDRRRPVGGPRRILLSIRDSPLGANGRLYSCAQTRRRQIETIPRGRHLSSIVLSKKGDSRRARFRALDQPADQIPTRNRDRTPCKPTAPRDPRPPPLYTLLRNISEMPKGGHIGHLCPMANFLFFQIFLFRRVAWRPTTNPGRPWENT